MLQKKKGGRGEDSCGIPNWILLRIGWIWISYLWEKHSGVHGAAPPLALQRWHGTQPLTFIFVWRPSFVFDCKSSRGVGPSWPSWVICLLAKRLVRALAPLSSFSSTCQSPKILCSLLFLIKNKVTEQLQNVLFWGLTEYTDFWQTNCLLKFFFHFFFLFRGPVTLMSPNSLEHLFLFLFELFFFSFSACDENFCLEIWSFSSFY